MVHDDFLKRFNSLVKNEYSLLSIYKKMSEDITIKHNKCGKIYSVRAGNFLYLNYRCKCKNKTTKRKTLDYAKQKFLEKNLLLLETEYKNEETLMKYKCLKCGDTNLKSLARIDFDNTGCPNCAGNKKKTIFDIKKEIENNDGYIVVDNNNFKNVHSPLIIKHSCGFIFKMSFNNFRNGQRCPLCSKKLSSGGISKAVKNIINYLIKNNINFEREKIFENFKKNKKHYRFDFFFQSKKLIIEYHGKQHYKFEKTGFFNEQKILNIQKDDIIKKEFIINNNINYEVIKYTDNEIEKLKEILEKYKDIV